MYIEMIFSVILKLAIKNFKLGNASCVYGSLLFGFRLCKFMLAFQGVQVSRDFFLVKMNNRIKNNYTNNYVSKLLLVLFML